MFLSFNLLVFLFWFFITSVLPGVLISFSLLNRKEEQENEKDGEHHLSFIEKFFIGAALGTILVPLIPLILYLFGGIKFSYEISILSEVILYAAALALFVRNGLHNDLLKSIKSFSAGEHFKFSLPKGADPLNTFLSKEFLVSVSLLVILAVTYLIRIGSYGPIFQELDPYYYTYPAQQILTLGENPFDDQTAWYPEVVANHRVIPFISYLEATWYSFYTGGGTYNNMLLAIIASMYPPIAAVFAVFSVYLMLSAMGKREWGLITAGIVTSVSMFIFKLSAGEQETQPYAFFALLFFYAMYVLALKRKGVTFPVLAGLAFMALSLGSSSQVLALMAVVLFLIAQAILFFIRDEDALNLLDLIKVNAIVFIIGPLLGSSVLKSMFGGGLTFSIPVAFLIPILFIAVLYILKTRATDKSQANLGLIAVLIIGLLAFSMTPFGNDIKGMARTGFEITQYNTALDHTIAEQGTAPGTFDDTIGFIAKSYPAPSSGNASPLQIIDTLAYFVLLPFSMIANFLLSIFVSLVNLALSTTISFPQKEISMLLFWISLFFIVLVYTLLKFFKKEDDTMFIFVLSITMLPLVVGLIKTKYTIYAGVMFAVVIGFTLYQISRIISELKDENRKKSLRLVPLFVGLLLVFLQFNTGLAAPLLYNSFKPLYQNDPVALASKFQGFCQATGDSEVCAAASDPIGFASKGTNFQYNTKLCFLSVLSQPSYGAAPQDEVQAASLRCQRISTYWIESMEWIKHNTEPNSRITSWWDYGHWLNYFGQRNAVLRNEHLSKKMIGDVAHLYLEAPPEELKQWMKDHDSKYALFDMELIAGGNTLGGKYGALNYLACARDNGTTVANFPGQSQCEANNLWETIFVSTTPCTISTISGKVGYTAYRVQVGDSYSPFYPSQCYSKPQDPNLLAYCSSIVRVVPTYCIGETTLVDGNKVFAPFSLNETYPTGDLKLHKAALGLQYQLEKTMHMGQVTSFTLFYDNKPYWLENGQAVSGYNESTSDFYRSPLYRALILNDLPGFENVYSTPDNMVKIFKIKD